MLQCRILFKKWYFVWLSVHYLEKWRHFVSSKTLLCFRVRVPTDSCF